MTDGFLFTSESVTEGHPDKVADQVSDAIVDAALAADPQSRVAVETLLTTGLVVLAGEITTNAVLDFAAIARQVICDIGYDTGDFGFDGNAVGVITALDRQSPDIGRGVDASHDARNLGRTDPFDAVGAGDQGMMFGYASNETPELMPMPIVLAQLGDSVDDAVGQGDRQRHQLGRLVAGVAEHEPLVARADVFAPR